METRNERAARLFSEAITTLNPDAAVAICDPEIEFRSVLGIGGRAYTGHTGIRQYLDDVESAWAQWSVEVDRITEAGDGRVAIVMTMHARGKGSGASLHERTAHIWTLRDGRLLRNQPFREPHEALQALGLPTA
jgi:ketosteroid isomerase-like protein